MLLDSFLSVCPSHQHFLLFGSFSISRYFVLSQGLTFGIGIGLKYTNYSSLHISLAVYLLLLSVLRLVSARGEVVSIALNLS